MTRLLAIAVLITLAFLLFKYGTNKKVQHGVVIAGIAGISIYTLIVVVSELLR